MKRLCLFLQVIMLSHAVTNTGPGRRALRRMRQRSPRRWWVQQQVLMSLQRRLLSQARLTPLYSHQQMWRRRSGPVVRWARCALSRIPGMLQV